MMEEKGWARFLPLAGLSVDRFGAALAEVQPPTENHLELLARRIREKLPAALYRLGTRATRSASSTRRREGSGRPSSRISRSFAASSSCRNGFTADCNTGAQYCPQQKSMQLAHECLRAAVLNACGWIAIARIGAPTGRIDLFTRQRTRHKAKRRAASILGLETEPKPRGPRDDSCRR